jgi:NAD+ synthase (glutamine-hydrolysing)
MKITIAQMNPTVGDIQGNLSKIEQGLLQATKDGADLIVFSELFITGYPPKDLLERRWFLDKTQSALDDTVRLSKRNRYSPGISCKG